MLDKEGDTVLELGSSLNNSPHLASAKSVHDDDVILEPKMFYLP